MYYDITLGDIERNYGCVAEYNRLQEEAAEDAFEIEERQHEYYRRNKKLLEAAEKDGSAVFFCYDCDSCDDFINIGMTSEFDDIPHGRCCNLKKKCTYRLNQLED